MAGEVGESCYFGENPFDANPVFAHRAYPMEGCLFAVGCLLVEDCLFGRLSVRLPLCLFVHRA